MRSKIYSTSPTKSLNGKLLDGTMLCTLAEAYAHALNSGASLNIGDAWTQARLPCTAPRDHARAFAVPARPGSAIPAFCSRARPCLASCLGEELGGICCGRRASGAPGPRCARTQSAPGAAARPAAAATEVPPGGCGCGRLGEGPGGVGRAGVQEPEQQINLYKL